MVTANPPSDGAAGAPGEPLSHRAYAEHRKALGLPGGTAMTVGRAIKSERLKESIIYVGGETKIRDARLADAEWARNTDLSRAPGSVKAQAEGVTGGAVTPAGVTDTPVTPSSPPRRGKRANTLAEASTREKNAKADLAELEYQEKAGHLVSASAVEAAWGEMVAQIRTAVLSVPSKAKGLMPHLSYTDLAQWNDLLCQALEGLAAADHHSKGAAA